MSADVSEALSVRARSAMRKRVLLLALFQDLQDKAETFQVLHAS